MIATKQTLLFASVLFAAILNTPAAAQSQANNASPLEAPQIWIDPADYPFAAVRQNAEGVTRVRLDIDTEGFVSKCTVTQSSGHAILDDTACLRLEQRGRFEPARNAAGQRVAGNWSTAVVWTMPEAVRLPIPQEAHVEFIVDIDATGQMTNCEIVVAELPDDAPPVLPCESAQTYFPATDEDGNPISRRLRFRMQSIYEEVPE